MIYEVTFEERKTLLILSETEEDAIEMTNDEFYDYMTLADQTTVSCIALFDFDPNDASDDERVWNLDEEADAKIMERCFHCATLHTDSPRIKTQQVTDAIYNALPDGIESIKDDLVVYLEMAWLAMEGNSLNRLDLSDEEMHRLKKQLHRHLFIEDSDEEYADER